MANNSQKQLETQLWNIADTLRGKMDADEFRNYILGFIFYKYLSEQMERHADSILKEDGIKYKELTERNPQYNEILAAVAEDSKESLGYFLKPSHLFSEIAKRGNAEVKEGEEENSNFILKDLADIFHSIEVSTRGTDSEDDFDHLFEDLDLTSTKLGRTESAKNQLISKVLAHLNKIDFQLEDTSRDILGDAYEYLIGKFASGAGKKAGEFYTPPEVSTLLAKIVTQGKKKIKSAYDPTNGSGSLLLKVRKEAKVSKIYGQEMNRTTYNLARMNMIMHGVHHRDLDLKQDDSLEHPQHMGEKFEAIVANPPFSANWSASSLHLTDDRFSQYGKLAPKSKADYAFVQHMIYHLSDNGTLAVVLPHGVLFRGGAEGHIRQYLIEKLNYLDTVIGLPANLFYGTGIPTSILVFKKCRKDTDKVLFIDASAYFEHGSNQHKLREEDITRITDALEARKNIDRFSYTAKLEEIKENNYNLNIPRYVDTFEKAVSINLDAISNDINILEIASRKTDERIKDFCRELNIPLIF